MHDVPVRDLMKTEGEMDRHRNGFRGAGYQKVTSRVNEGGVRVQIWKSKRRRELEKNGFRIIIAETGGHVLSS